MELLRDFKKINRNDVALAGGKGASLGEMTRAGMSVPPGFVILSSAFEKFLEETDLNIEIDSVLHSVDTNKIHTVEHTSEKIHSLITGAEMPQDIASEIQKFFKKLKSKYVAVRSSATAEDSTSAAWAGQLESYLNTTEKNLLENVKKCWASLFTPRAIFYRFEKDLHQQKISVAVVVQKMAESEKSGIAFSVHPVTQDQNQLIIEAGLGLGEAIVSGQITPDSYVVEKQPRRIIDKNIQIQTKGLYRAKNGGNKWRDIPKEQGEKQVLSDKKVLELSEIILKIENHYSSPQDIEWAFQNGTFYIVQSRPITTLSLKKEKEGKLIFEKSITRDWPLFIVEMLHRGFTTEFQKQFGFRYTEVLFDIYSDHLDIYRAPVEHIKKMREFVLSKLAEDPKFVSKCSQFLLRYYKKFLEVVNTVDKIDLSELSSEELVKLLKNFIDIHAKLEPTFVINFWFPIQMENHPEKTKWYKEISVAVKTRAETEKVGPEGDRIARKLAQEISKRMFGNKKYSKLISLKEANDFLIKGKELQESEIKKRLKGFVFGIRGIDFTPINKYAELKGYEIKEVETKEDGIIRGNIAYPGLVKGRVRVVISKEKIGFVKGGDVLVTAMTTPEFMPALKKAVAFVTDEGGITSHAAIVARELKKPCIIGTKIATQVLKDGYMIEVDAEKGLIRIINKGGKSKMKRKFTKEQSREYSLFRVETLSKVLSQEFPKIIGAPINEMCAIYRGNDLVEIYYDPTEVKKIIEAFVCKVQDRKGENEVLENIKKFLNDFEKLKPYFTDKRYLDSIKKLKWFQKKYTTIWAYISMVFIIPTLPVSERLKKRAHEARVKTQEYNEAPETIFNKFMEMNFPKLKKDGRFILPDEIWNDEVKNKDIVSKIADRKRGYVFYRNQILTGELADNLEKLGIVLEEKDSFVSGKAEVTENEIKGQIANKGQVRGMVKIVSSTKDIPKVKEGDILVAAMTMPKYLPAMKKAAAFVTDEGGLTSHAAIVSREMNKPCIVGTKIATKILKDGDFVEINADKGVIKMRK